MTDLQQDGLSLESREDFGEDGDEDEDDEDDPGCCMRYCLMCGWIRQACAELGRLFCWPPVPSRIAAKLAFVPPPPHYSRH